MSELVSVLIPTYNGERYVGAALASAQAQTHEHLEILVGDDGSSDATPEIVREAARNDPRIRLIEQPENLGAPANQIALHHAARGTYIKPLLQDDLLAPHAVSRLLTPLQRDHRIGLAFGARQLIDADGRTLPDKVWNVPLADTDVVHDGWELGASMLERTTNHIGEVSCALYRRDAIGDLDAMWTLDDHQFGPIGDVVLWLKLLAHGPAFSTPDVLCSFRQHRGQTTRRTDVALCGAMEWPLATLAARRLGFFASPRRERQALSASLAYAAGGLRQGTEHPVWSRRLRDAISAVLTRLAHPDLRPLPAWYPIAVAAPAIEGPEITAAVQRLRTLSQDEAVGRCIIAVPAAAVDAAIPLVEHALAAGPDFDLELIPTDAPGEIVDGPWLAVAGGEVSWAASAAARVDPPESRPNAA